MHHITEDVREVRCVNDRYAVGFVSGNMTPDSLEGCIYENVAEFIDIVSEFIEAPLLTEHKPGEWVDERGHVTLEVVA